MARVREIELPWTQQPQEAVQLDPTYPWELFVSRVQSPHSLTGPSMWSKAGENKISAFDVAASPGGVGMPLTAGLGGRLQPADGGTLRRGVYTGVVALYIAPGSANGQVSLGWNSSSGLGQTTFDLGAAGNMTVLAPNENWVGAANIAIPGDWRGRVICVAMSGGRALGAGTISVRAALNGSYLGEAGSTGATGINASGLAINPGNGFNGLTGVLLYAGQWLDTRLADPETLVALSHLWAPFAPQRLWLPTSAAPAGVPDISFVGAENILVTSTGYRVSLNYA